LYSKVDETKKGLSLLKKFFLEWATKIDAAKHRCTSKLVKIGWSLDQEK